MKTKSNNSLGKWKLLSLIGALVFSSIGLFAMNSTNHYRPTVLFLGVICGIGILVVKIIQMLRD